MRWEHGSLGLGFILLGIAHYMGLFVAPTDAMMGDVGRILYAHVPTAWVALVMLTASFVGAVGSLWNGRYTWDAATTALAEVGTVLTGLLLFQGAIWAKPTWGVFWSWDPRLTSSAVLFVMFVAVLILRRVVDTPERRLTVTAIATIVAFVDVPIVYMSVKWWNSLHQTQSAPKTVSETMHLPLRMAAFAMLFIAIGIAVTRWRTIMAGLTLEAAAPDLPTRAPTLNLREEGA